MGSLGVLYRMQLSNADVPVTRRCYFSIRWRTGGNYTRADGSLAGGSYVVHIYCLFWTVNGRGKWPLRAIAADGRSRVHRETGQLHGAGVGPTKGLSEKSLNRSLSSIHILYNHTPRRGVGRAPGRRTPLLNSFHTEVVLPIVQRSYTRRTVGIPVYIGIPIHEVATEEFLLRASFGHSSVWFATALCMF